MLQSWLRNMYGIKFIRNRKYSVVKNFGHELKIFLVSLRFAAFGKKKEHFTNSRWNDVQAIYVYCTFHDSSEHEPNVRYFQFSFHVTWTKCKQLVCTHTSWDCVQMKRQTLYIAFLGTGNRKKKKRWKYSVWNIIKKSLMKLTEFIRLYLTYIYNIICCMAVYVCHIM